MEEEKRKGPQPEEKVQKKKRKPVGKANLTGLKVFCVGELRDSLVTKGRKSSCG